ncbi:response regulator transcription factor [Paenibacillus aurantius]|uniref:Response regulator transcription factor n=1 Tax=Paenibacillus aurantius TaxID=2918900 RepID=A0AA96LI95_9BACL|nr:response regulator transcription factor [Paenibacillus aurantius]WNQ13823.1 response regulator transcription factor [Paenibacillus aurantius]
MTAEYRVLLVDDNAFARQGMAEILSMDPIFKVVAEGADGREALELTEKWMPDLILMDINMPELDGLEATKRIKDRYPYVKIVMVTVSDDITDLFEALKKGAQGYLLKNLRPTAWHEYLRAIATDEVPMSRELALQFLREFTLRERSQPKKLPLTAREQEILELVAKGLSNREISERLIISEHTVKNHLKNLLQKLHLENRVQLTRFAFEQGLF